MASSRQIAEWLDLSAVAGDAAVVRVSSIEDADESSAVFVTTRELLTGALLSRAGLILAPPELSSSASDPRVLLVPDVRFAFAVLARHLSGNVAPVVHASALVATSAVTGPGLSVGPGSVIGDGVRIGADCSIGAHVVIEQNTLLGDRVKVQSGAVLGAWGFGYVRRTDGSYLRSPQQGTLVIEDDVEIGANTTIDRGALGETRIGAGTKIDNLVHIGHNCVIGRNVVIAAQTGISGSSVVEDGAILGGQVGIGEHATVGPNVILGGGAGVLSGKRLRGPGQVFWGRPAQPLRQYLRDLARLRRGV